MSNPGHTRPGGLRPGFDVLPDGRGRMVTMFKLASGYQIRSDLRQEWGVLYSAVEKVDCTGPRAHLAGLRLIDGQETQQTSDGWVWVRIYEDLPATAEIQVGKNRRMIGDDGRVEIHADFLQLSSATRTPGTIAVTTPPAPDAAAGVLATEDPQDDGAVRRIARVYVAAGLLSTSAVDVGGGLKDVTWVSVRTRQAPTFGVLRRDDVNKPEGIPVYTVTKRQSVSGGDPTGVSIDVPRDVSVTFPGRAKPFKETYNGRVMLDLYKSAPATFPITATVRISYTTSPSSAPTYTRWRPTSWATMRAQWVGLRNEPVNLVQELPGFRTVGSGTPISATQTHTVATGWDYVAGGISVTNGEPGSIFGNPIYGGTTARITVTGGPAAPDGATFTLDLDHEEAFVDLAGTQYYRRTEVFATFPTQEALPV